MTVTIKDIAKAAGVSHTTVSRALRDSPSLSPATIATIKSLADEMNYVPNAAARGLRTKRSNALGVIVRRIDDPFFAHVLNGIEDVLQADSYSLLLAASNRNFAKEEQIFNAMSARRVDGIIICSTHISPENRKQLGRYGVPIVLVNNQAASDGVSSVSHDDTFGARAVSEHLLEGGHRTIAYIGNGNSGRTNDERLLGYQQALTNAGIVVRPELIITLPNGRAEAGAEAAATLLQLPALPSAVVCYNDMIALGVMFALQRAGVRIPQDCSITGFDNIPLTAHVNPPLTTFDQPKFELGQTAARMMLRMIAEGDDGRPEAVRLRGSLTVRGSTAAAKTNVSESKMEQYG